MVRFASFISQKFKNIAGNRYEEILKSYEDFFLTEEEMVIPDVGSVLIALDRYSEEVPSEVYEAISAYPNAGFLVVYVVDENVLRLIRSTLGDKEAQKFQEKEEQLAEERLSKVEKKLRELGISPRRGRVFGDKGEYLEELTGKYDLLVISKHYGSETTKTHPISPVVFRVVQGIKKPVVIY
ncbi:adenine nucleotide alpha hydrolase family protein [Thermococcus sp.]|uniref:universal stress protein n=1 Tax=Thermococcus sp. TaxID=35749 RepID=UPI00261821BE|nr:universal stress protein [Thermococcus sp.]